jgi:3-hydroxyethyl bacteriochlorophyllide a dehydrogenase
MNTQSSSAVVCTGPRQVELRRVGLPELGADEVVVSTLSSGVSTGTDRWAMQGRFGWAVLEPPFVPGYQRAGIVTAVGGDVQTVAVGQQVVATNSRDFVGARAAWGGHTGLGVTRAADVYDATGLDPQRAAFVVVAQVGVNAAARITLLDGPVTVYGDGVIGTSAALAARARGFDVTVVGRHAERLDVLAELGLAIRLSSDTSAEGAGRHPVAVIDTVHNEDAFGEYVVALPPRTGQIVYSGHSPDNVTAWADMAELQRRELTAHFVSGWTDERLAQTLSLMRSDVLPMERLVGRVAQTPAEVVELMTDVAHGRVAAVAALIDWTDSSDWSLRA